MVNVLYCDRQMVAAVKPAGLITQGEFDTQVIRWICETEKRERAFLEPIHRLDKAVSGIVLFARSSKALTRMQESMRKRDCQKGYIAWAEGRFEKEEQELEHLLLKGEYRTKVDTAGKSSTLNYRVVKQEDHRALLLIALKTGRYHQIRAQLSAIGHPLIGDEKYGGCKGQRVLLHHARTVIPHPISKQECEFVDPPPFAPHLLEKAWLAWFSEQYRAS